MKAKFSLVILMLVSLLGAQLAQARPANNLREYAHQLIQSVRQGAEECGMRLVHAPQGTPTPADYLFVNQRNFVVAHVIDRGNYFVVKNPLGGMSHSIKYSIERLSLVTPYQGKVGGANRYTTGNGWQYNFYCRSQPVNAETFDQCAQRRFVGVLVNRLCNSQD